MDAIVQAKEVASGFGEKLDDIIAVRDLPITSEDEQEFAADGVRWVKSEYQLVEDTRRRLTDPLNGVIKTINDMFRTYREACLESERVLKQRIAAYLAEKDRKNRLALEAAASAPTVEKATEALQQVAPVAPPAGVSVRYVWRFEVVDEALLPREYLCPDLPKIGRVVGETRGEVNIPGVRVFQEPIVASRRR